MFMIGLLSIAALGGAAYAMSDVFVAGDDPEEDDITDEEAGDIPEGEYLDIGGNVDEPTTEESPVDPGAELEANTDPDIENPVLSTGSVVSEFDGDLVIAGAENVDLLAGQDGDDQINGYDGDDTIGGGAGHDVLYGGEGADNISGGEGDDVLQGEGGDDQLSGDNGDDSLYGHSGEDQLSGGDGNDMLNGGQGDDTLAGGDGDDALHGGFGDDTLQGGTGEDVLFGGHGSDVLTGGGDSMTDFLNGGDGDDTILADSGDIVTGGNGADEVILAPEAGDDTITVMDFQPGQDKLLISWEGQDDPEIRVEADAENENLTHVLVDDQEVAQLLGADGLTTDDIQVISGTELAQLSALG